MTTSGKILCVYDGALDESRSFAAGVNVMNPQSWNLYNYALNNPLRMVDRNGYWATDIHAQIVTYSLQNYVSSGELNVLRARQYSMDADQSDQNRHSMANTGQSSQDASMECGIMSEMK